MPTRMACATGNFDAASTWKEIIGAAANVTQAYIHAETAAHALTTAYSGSRTSAFTPGAVEIDGIGLRLAQRVGTTGTMSVHLILSSDNSEVAGTEVVINTADLPAYTVASAAGWLFFKFAAPVTLLAATDYKVEAKTSSATQVNIWRDATAANLSRFIRTTTTSAPALDASDMIVCREYTGQGTSNVYTVTMDRNDVNAIGSYPGDSTVFAAISVSDGCTLTWPRNATTFLLLNGNLIVYQGGVFDMGSAASRIQGGYTAALRFGIASNGRYGIWIRAGATVTAAGVVRNRVALLTADATSSATVWSVSDTTGWQDDEVVISQSATVTTTGAEKKNIATVDSGTQITVESGLTAARSGTAPYQAEVLNLSSNVSIEGPLSNINAYINIGTIALPFSAGSVAFDNVRFLYLGMSTATRDGIPVALSGTATVSFVGCAWYYGYYGVRVLGMGASNTLTIDKCCGYSTAHACIHVSGTNTGALIITDNCAIQCSVTAVGAISLTSAISASSVITGNRVANSVGTVNVGFTLSMPSTGGPLTMLAGTFANNVAHNCRRGFLLHMTGGTITTCHAWRCDQDGWVVGSGSGGGYLENVVFDQCTSYLNTTSDINVVAAGSVTECVWKACHFGSSRVFNLASDAVRCRLEACVVGATATVAYLVVSATSGVSTVDIVFDNCTLTLFTIDRLTLFGQWDSVIASYRVTLHACMMNGTATTQTVSEGGYVSRDTTVTRSSGASVKVEAQFAAVRPTSTPPFMAAVASGATVTPSVWVYLASGTAALPTLIVKKNRSAGILADTVLDTAINSTGVWQELTGPTAAVAADAVLEFVVAAFFDWVFYVDDFTVN